MDAIALSRVIRVRWIHELIRSGALDARRLADRTGTTRATFSKHEKEFSALDFITVDSEFRPMLYRVSDEASARRFISQEMEFACERARFDEQCFPLLLELGRMSEAERRRVAAVMQAVLASRKDQGS